MVKGDIYYSITYYEAEANQAVDLVEGEKVYVMETQESEWWLIKKHLTEETGWVPAKILMTEQQYVEYVQKKLNEKIDKLPVFESKIKSLTPCFNSQRIKSLTNLINFSIYICFFRTETSRENFRSKIRKETPTKSRTRWLQSGVHVPS